jgi:catechol 2,3-dioxygenase-like lactoylglutathione lyase family enzyme
MARGLRSNSRLHLRSRQRARTVGIDSLVLLAAAALAVNCSNAGNGRRPSGMSGGSSSTGGNANANAGSSAAARGGTTGSGAAPSSGGTSALSGGGSSTGGSPSSAGVSTASSGSPANGGGTSVSGASPSGGTGAMSGGPSAAGADSSNGGISGAVASSLGGNSALSGAGGTSGAPGAAGAAPVTFPSNLPADDGVGHFHHVHLNVVDPAATMAFFTQWFTGEITTLPGGRPALWTQASWILFDQVDTPAPSAIVSSIYHIGWTVLDIQTSYNAMVAGGVPFDTPLTDISTVFGGTGGAQFAYATGPDHELVEFYNGSDDHFRHVHFVSDDPVSAGQWYQKHFGAVSMTANPSRATGSVNGRQIKPNMSVTIDAITVWWYPTGFVQATYPDDWKGLSDLVPQRGRVIDHIALGVDNLPAALTRLQSEGVTIIEQPAWRMDGAFISAFVQGPDSVDVEVVQGRAMHP